MVAIILVSCVIVSAIRRQQIPTPYLLLVVAVASFFPDLSNALSDLSTHIRHSFLETRILVGFRSHVFA